jgi:urease accessory protein
MAKTSMLRIEHVLGGRLDPAFAERIHQLEHRGAVDLLTVLAADVSRHRFRATTQGGTEVAIALPRDQRLFDGAVLVLEPDHAVVVRLAQERWLRLQPRAIADAIELGYQAGNLHWRVRFAGEALLVALEAPMDDYLARLSGLIRDRRVISSLAEIDEVAP